MSACTRFTLRAAAAAAALAGVAGARDAGADNSIIRDAGHPLIAHWELEPHGLLGWRTYYGRDVGVGVGLRASIVLSPRAFVRTINNSVAISFGGDLSFYQDCYWRYYADYVAYWNVGCNTTVLSLPVAMQWNFFLSQRWSVFAEPGLQFYFAFYDDPCAQVGACAPGWYRGSHWGFDFAGWIGARVHFNDHVALTIRIGYPNASVGVSFF